MRDGKHGLRAAAGLGLCLGVMGCMALPELPGWQANGRAPAGAAPARPTVADGPELRLRDDDVPLVPLPLPPLNSSRDRPPSAPAAPGASRVVPAAHNADEPKAKTSPTATPAATPDRADPDAVRKLVRQAVGKYAPIDSYIARLTRREVVGTQKKPEEVMLFKFRKQPWSVYFKWLGEAGRGREVVFVKGKYDNKLQMLLAAGDMPFVPAGKRFSISPDSLAVRSSSRHPITEAGLGASLDRLSAVLDAQERGDRRRGTLTSLGLVTRTEFSKPLPMIEHTVPAGAESDLPGGGRRLYGFDPETALPVLIVTTDNRGNEVEYYRYDRLQISVRLDDDDFNPDKLWPVKP
jgi:hypothetical protein